MSRSADLTGLGFSPPQANAVGNTAFAKTGVGTALAGGTALQENSVNVLTTSSGQTAFVLPSVGAGGGPVVVINPSATTALVYPNTSSETIQGGSAGASFSVAQNKTAIFFKGSSTAWGAILTA